MKYVMLKPLDGGMPQPVFAVAPMKHDALAAAFKDTHRPVSAGFFEFDRMGRGRTSGHSESLGLSPGADDAYFIEAMIRATLELAKLLPTPVDQT